MWRLRSPRGWPLPVREVRTPRDSSRRGRTGRRPAIPDMPPGVEHGRLGGDLGPELAGQLVGRVEQDREREAVLVRVPRHRLARDRGIGLHAEEEDPLRTETLGQPAHLGRSRRRRRDSRPRSRRARPPSRPSSRSAGGSGPARPSARTARWSLAGWDPAPRAPSGRSRRPASRGRGARPARAFAAPGARPPPLAGTVRHRGRAPHPPSGHPLPGEVPNSSRERHADDSGRPHMPLSVHPTPARHLRVERRATTIASLTA